MHLTYQLCLEPFGLYLEVGPYWSVCHCLDTDVECRPLMFQFEYTQFQRTVFQCHYHHIVSRHVLAVYQGLKCVIFGSGYAHLGTAIHIWCRRDTKTVHFGTEAIYQGRPYYHGLIRRCPWSWRRLMTFGSTMMPGGLASVVGQVLALISADAELHRDRLTNSLSWGWQRNSGCVRRMGVHMTMGCRNRAWRMMAYAISMRITDCPTIRQRVRCWITHTLITGYVVRLRLQFPPSDGDKAI